MDLFSYKEGFSFDGDDSDEEKSEVDDVVESDDENVEDVLDTDEVEEEEIDEIFEDVPGEAVALSVAAAVDVINDQLFRIAGPELLVEGEVAEYGVSQGKWIRFTLKDIDDGALLKCFATTFQLKDDLENGDRIIVSATPKIYPKYGTFTLNVNSVEHVGEGAIAKKLAALKKKLEGEGLFDESRKRDLPEFVSRIGLITSRDAAAFTDFVRILGNRWGDVDVDLCHVYVQGDKAPPDIVRAIELFNSLEVDKPDVLVLTRGGGSLEDLMAFNDEAVVRAVFSSSIPIVVGVGHERDESLSEFAADFRASTPSHAAEVLVPDKDAVLRGVDMTVSRMVDRVDECIRGLRLEVDSSVSRISHIMQVVRFEVERAVAKVDRFGELMLGMLKSARDKVDAIERYLSVVDPVSVLKRGYSIVRVGGKVVLDSSQLDKGDVIEVQFATGNIKSEVK